MDLIKFINVSHLPTIIGNEIWYYTTLLSGFEKAKELIELYPKGAHGRIIFAGEILRAKGRFDRIWFAPKGGLWCVVTLYDELLPENNTLLSILFGLASVKSVRSFGIPNVNIKWINDLHFKGKKLAGILIQRYKEWILAGIGLNINNPLPSSLPAINLKSLLGREIKITDLLGQLVLWLNFYYSLLWEYEKEAQYCKLKNPLIEDLKKYSDTLGQCIFYSYNLDLATEGIYGIAKDFTEKGALIISTNNEEIEVSAGEIIYI